MCSAVVTARFLKCVLLSHASHACDHTHTHTHTHTANNRKLHALHSSITPAGTSARSRPHSTESGAEVLELDYQGDFQATRSARNPATILQVAVSWRTKTEMTEFRTWVSSDPKCFQVLGLSPSLL